MKRIDARWSPKTELLIKDLHSELILNNNNWHKLKTNNSRRAAELLTSALSQIIHGGKTSDIEDLINQSLLWIRAEIKDPGCPTH
tara:strand:+ start:217 stop:471 length:255 start_codon:yes stop_codon:yes gene_type:complete